MVKEALLARPQSVIKTANSIEGVLENLAWLPTFDGFERFHSESFIAMSDLQCPYVNPDLVRKACAIGKKLGASECILAGDTFNQTMFSKFLSFMGEQTWTFEMEVVSEILQLLLGTFETIYVTSGNHDRNILKLLLGKVGLKHIFKWVTPEVGKRVKVSEYPYCYVTSGKETIRITHPDSYSRIPGRVAQTLSGKWECSVLSAHGHRLALTFSDSGHWVGDLGGMFDETKIDYKNMRDTTHGQWNSGFFAVQRGFPYLFSRDSTDWDWWLK
jgi:hypothetical protein